MASAAARNAARRALSSAAGGAMPPTVALPCIDLRALDARKAGSAAALAARSSALKALRAACEAPVGAFEAVTEAIIAPALVQRVYGHCRAFHALPDVRAQFWPACALTSGMPR